MNFNAIPKYSLETIEQPFHHRNNGDKGVWLAFEIEKSILEAIGNRIRAYRKEKGWSQEDLAHETGLAMSQISKIESGQSSIFVKTLIKISLGLDLDHPNLLLSEIQDIYKDLLEQKKKSQ